jgi:ABC-type dipeptide/oligopeptide/nickel transport system permease subunit
MDFILAGFIEAVRLLLGGDDQTWSAVAATVKASSASMAASLILGVPLGFLLGYFDFPAKRQVRLLVDTALALPTVFIGLVVYAFISNRGPLGEMGLLFPLRHRHGPDHPGPARGDRPERNGCGEYGPPPANLLISLGPADAPAAAEQPVGGPLRGVGGRP